MARGEPSSAGVRTAPSSKRRVFSSAIAVANVAIFLFQIMLARITSPALYGGFVALLGVLLLIEAPASTLQVLISRAVQRIPKPDRAKGAAVDLDPLMAVSLLIGVLLCGVLLALMPTLSQFLRLSHVPYLVAFYAIPVLLAVAPKGVLIGLGNFTAVSIGLVASAVVRLGAGTALVHSGYGVNGAIGAVVIGEVFSCGILLLAARPPTRWARVPLDFRWRDAAGEGVAFTGFWILTGIDVILGRHYLSDVGAGEYAAAATLSQLVMVFPSAAAVLLFPRLIGTKTSVKSAGTNLARGLIAVTGVSLAVATLVRIFGHPLLHLVFDQQYEPAITVIGPLLLSAAALGLVTVLLQYLLSRDAAVPAGLSWLGIVGFAVGAHFAHGSMRELAFVLLCSTAATAVVMLIMALHGLQYFVRPDQSNPDLSHLDASLDLTVVVPYYNPGAMLAPNVRRLLEVLERSPADFEVIAVSDGSTDGSDMTITDLEGDRLRHVILPLNQGKGAALRVGLAAGRGRYLGFIDADGDLDPQLLESFMALVDLYEPDIVIGSKRHPLSTVHYPPLRWMYSIGFQYLVRFLFRLNVRDTQTGLKLVRRDVLAASLPRMLEKRFAFDLELLVVARRLGYPRFLEAPIVLQHQFKSTVSVRSVKNTLIDTLAIFYRLRILRTYDRVPANTELRLAPTFLRGADQLGR